MKKRIFTLSIIIISLLLLIPIPLNLKDGGSTEYKALLYKITKVHRLNEKSITGYEEGWQVEILGFKIYNKIVYEARKNKFEIGEISNIIPSLDKGVSLLMKELKNPNATFILRNDTGRLLDISPDWSLEVKQNEFWYKVIKQNTFVNEIAYYTNANLENEIQLSGFETLIKGEYRYIMYVSFHDEFSNGLYNGFYVAKEFTIK